MSKFKVGDRVAIYGAFLNWECPKKRIIAEVIGNMPDTPEDLITVYFKYKGDEFRKWVHPKQCRKLTSKKPFRRAWVTYRANDPWGVAWETKEIAERVLLAECFNGEVIEMVEVRRKK